MILSPVSTHFACICLNKMRQFNTCFRVYAFEVTGAQHYHTARLRIAGPTLKRKCLHFDEIFITGCTESCQNDNFQCSQWWKFRQNDIFVSVYVKGFRRWSAESLRWPVDSPYKGSVRQKAFPGQDRFMWPSENVSVTSFRPGTPSFRLLSNVGQYCPVTLLTWPCR